MLEKYYAEIYKNFDEPKKLYMLLCKVAKKNRLTKILFWINIVILFILIFLISKNYINEYLGFGFLIILFGLMLKIIEVLGNYSELDTQIDLIISIKLAEKALGGNTDEKIYK